MGIIIDLRRERIIKWLVLYYLFGTQGAELRRALSRKMVEDFRKQSTKELEAYCKHALLEQRFIRVIQRS